MAYEELINKKVLVIKTDGFKKIGLLRSIKDGLVALEFYDNKVEYVPLVSVSSIRVVEE